MSLGAAEAFGIALAATVWRVDGARVANGVSIADLLCTNGVLRTPARFAIEWKNTTGIDPNADTDGDGLSDGDEVFHYDTDPRCEDSDGDGLSDMAEILAGANPLDADENGDGVPDGITPADWASHPLWATNSIDGANVAIHLDRPVPEGGSAVLRLGTLSIPLKEAGSWELRIPEGPSTPFALRTTRGAAALLSISAPEGGATDPIHLDDPAGVFRVREDSPPERRLPARRAANDVPASAGEGHLCVFDVRFANYETGEPAPADECIHDETGVRWLTLQFSDPVHEGMAPTWSDPVLVDGSFRIPLSVSMEPGDSDSTTLEFTVPELVCGSKTLAAAIHRCSGGRLVRCEACDMLHNPDDPYACPHGNGCPAKTDASADCTCPIPVIRVDGTGTSLSEQTRFDFPSEAECCCSSPRLFSYARLLRMDPNLSFGSYAAPGHWVDPRQCPDHAMVYATGESGSAPSEIEYEIVHRRYDGDGNVTTNESAGTRTLRVWATTPTLEPITIVRTDDRILNPCGIMTNETATFRLDVSPAAFPDSLIEWSASPAGRVRFVGDVRTGRQVSVVGVSTGDVTLTANITGYAGPPPLVRARVMPRTTVPVYAWIVCGTNGVPAVEEPILREKFPEINRIWDQAGITWQLAEVNFVTNENWLRVSSATNGNYDALCSYGVPHDGVELYCVEETKKSLGMTSMRGAVVEGASSATIYAHEFGHFCDLKDVYTSHIPETILSVSGVAEKDRFSKDWPSNSHEGYYLNGLSQISVLRRLLMHGRYEPGQSDLSAGDVDGLWNNRHLDDHQQTWVDNYELGMVPLGFLEHGNKQPQGE